MKNKNFSLTSYKYLLNVINSSKKKVITFEEFFRGNNGIIMRHDIDFCPVRALHIAKIEYDFNIKSTFFVMLNSKLYSLKKQKYLHSIKKIISLGHFIGLHFDPNYYFSKSDELDYFCNKECESLEKLIKKKIKIISFHRPAKKFIGRKTKIASRYHTYMPELIKDIKYCSDSEGKWRFEDPIKLIKDNTLKSIQLLTHPIWWTTPGELSSGEKINLHLKGQRKEKKLEAALNCKPYKSFLKSNPL